jgi:hypothetical protein
VDSLEWPENEYATHPCHRGDGGTLSYVKDEYDSLANGGSYEKWYCTVHGDHWFMMED